MNSPVCMSSTYDVIMNSQEFRDYGRDFNMIGRDFMMVRRDFQSVIATFSISVICFSDPFPLVYWLSILNDMWGMRIVDVILVLFCENRVIFKTSWSIVWSEALLFGTSVVGSYTENGNIGKSGNWKYIIFLGGLIGALELRDCLKDVKRRECELENSEKKYSSMK